MENGQKKSGPMFYHRPLHELSSVIVITSPLALRAPDPGPWSRDYLSLLCCADRLLFSDNIQDQNEQPSNYHDAEENPFLLHRYEPVSGERQESHQEPPPH